MAEEKWHENGMVRVALATGFGFVILMILVGLFHDPAEMTANITPTDYQSGDWVSVVPESLRGSWAVDGRCDDDDSLMVIFSNGAIAGASHARNGALPAASTATRIPMLTASSFSCNASNNPVTRQTP